MNKRYIMIVPLLSFLLLIFDDISHPPRIHRSRLGYSVNCFVLSKCLFKGALREQLVLKLSQSTQLEQYTTLQIET